MQTVPHKQKHLPRLIGERSAFVNSNPVDYALVNKSSNGRRSYISRLNQVAKLFHFAHYKEVPWHLFRHEHMRYVMSELKTRKLSTATVNTTVSTLRTVCREAFKIGQLNGDDFARILNVKLEADYRPPSGRYVSQTEIDTLVSTCTEDDNSSGIRDIAIIGLLYMCGLRRSEVTALIVGDFDRSDSSISVRNKSNVRKCWPDAGTVAALLDWLSARGAQNLENNSPLFTPVLKGGRIAVRAMTDQAVYNALGNRCLQAGVRSCTPQDLRGSFVTNLLDNDIDVITTQKLAGHLNLATTLRYDRRASTSPSPVTVGRQLAYSGSRSRR